MEGTNTPALPETPAQTQQQTQINTEAPIRGRRPIRSTVTRTHRRTQSPSPNRNLPSPASSYASARSSSITSNKMTVSELRQSLTNAGISIPTRCNKSELLKLYEAIPSPTPPPQDSRPTRSRHTPYPQPSATQHSRNPPGPPKKATKKTNKKQPQATGQKAPSTNQHTVNPPDNYATPGLPTPLLWPPAPQSSENSSPTLQAIPPTLNPPQFSLSSNLPHSSTQLIPNLSSNLPHSSTQLIPTQSFPTSSNALPLPANFSSTNPPFFPSTSLQAPTSITNPPQQNAFCTNTSSARAPFTLATATPLPIPHNAPVLEPPQISNTVRNLILSEIQRISAGGGAAPDAHPSLFRDDIPINHPMHDLHQASISLIMQAVAPRTLQAYLTAWKTFKHFHSLYNTTFPNFSLLTITSFITYLHSHKHIQANSIKSYLSGIQFFHKLMYGSSSESITNSQTSLLIKGIQKTRPPLPDTRLPITHNILAKCISTLRKGYFSFHTDHTLDAMFILAFFGFLRCSEFTVTSKFDPSIHPTIADLTLIDEETIAFLIKQSKTDQSRKGHYIYIFNIPSPTSPFQTLLAYTHYRKTLSASPLDPLFIDDTHHPVTRFWFQKHLKYVLTNSGFPSESYSSHSFRIGAATTAAHKGLSQQHIQTLGRWSSDAFKTYIRLSHSHLREAQRTLTSRCSYPSGQRHEPSTRKEHNPAIPASRGQRNYQVSQGRGHDPAI
nr:proline and serine-rich protein 1-like [Danio rerio]|eukprot:XP_009304434.1 proline and serine-rich protein 1-like [Danio rerio]